MSKSISKKKKIKRSIILVILALILVGAVLGVSSLRERNNKAYVQRVGDMNDTWVLSNAETSGTVAVGAEQSIRLQGTERVREVFVTPGQQVSEGQALFSYDTASMELEVKQRELEVNSCSSSLSIARQQLTAYENIVPSQPPAPVDPEPYQLTPAQQLPAAYQGEGSAEDPFVFLCREETLLSGSQLNQWIARGQVAVLEIREGNDIGGQLSQAWQVDGRNFLTVEEDSLWSVASRQRFIPPVPEPEPEPAGPFYTQAEKDSLIAKQKLTIRRMENSLALAENALEQSRLRLANATVRATMAGTVKTIGDPAAPPQDGTPFCTVIAASGVTVTGYLSELDRAKSQLGDQVTVFSWMSGESATATITAISDYPSSVQYWQGQGNPNVSYYEFTAYMESGGGGFEAGQGVTIKPYMDEATDAIVLMSIYVRTDEQGAYMMVDDGAGRLTRRAVTVEPTSESNYLQITSGLSLDDYYAFPYGDTAREGALTTTEMSLMSQLF